MIAYKNFDLLPNSVRFFPSKGRKDKSRYQIRICFFVLIVFANISGFEAENKVDIWSDFLTFPFALAKIQSHSLSLT